MVRTAGHKRGRYVERDIKLFEEELVKLPALALYCILSDLRIRGKDVAVSSTRINEVGSCKSQTVKQLIYHMLHQDLKIERPAPQHPECIFTVYRIDEFLNTRDIHRYQEESFLIIKILRLCKKPCLIILLTMMAQVFVNAACICRCHLAVVIKRNVRKLMDRCGRRNV